MKKIVYLLGTSHIYQHGDSRCEIGSIDAFIEYLDKVCQSYGINAIGEEISTSALKDFGNTESIPKKFAATYRKFHKYCDPTRDEKIKLGIRETHNVELDAFNEEKVYSEKEIECLVWEEHLKREPFWLCKIQELDKWPILFICGENHIKSFTSLLETIDTVVHVVHKNWSPNVNIAE